MIFIIVVHETRTIDHFDGAGELTAAHALPGWLPQAFLSLGTVRGSGAGAAALR